MKCIPILFIATSLLVACTVQDNAQTSQINDDQLSCAEILSDIEVARRNSAISRSDELTTLYRRNCTADTETAVLESLPETSSAELQELNRLFGRGLISEDEYNAALERLNR